MSQPPIMFGRIKYGTVSDRPLWAAFGSSGAPSM